MKKRRKIATAFLAMAAVCACVLIAGVDVGTSSSKQAADQVSTSPEASQETASSASNNDSSATSGASSSAFSQTGSSATSNTSSQTSSSGSLFSDLSHSDMYIPDEDEEGDEYAEDMVLVSFASGTDTNAVRAALASYGLYADEQDISTSLSDSTVLSASITGDESVADTLLGIAGSDDTTISYAQANYAYELIEGEDMTASTTSISDLYADMQYHLETINAYDAWDTVRVNGEVAVAIIDTGVDTDHGDLVDRIITGHNSVSKNSDYEDTNGHGTHVAGIIAATTDNEIGVSGVSYNANIISIKATSSTTTFYTSALAEAYSWLLKDADGDGTSDMVATYNLHVINMSLGAKMSVPGRDFLLNTYIDAAYDQDILTVCAAGNDGAQNVGSTNTNYPSDYETCMSVISVDSDLKRASSSNYGDAKDISAPGVSIASTYRGNGYATLSGTSMASPVVAGVAALVFAKDDTYTAAQVREILEQTAQDIGDEGYDNEAAWGCVDAQAAVTANIVTISGGEHAKISDGTTSAATLFEVISNGDTISKTFTVAADRGWEFDQFEDAAGNCYDSIPTGSVTASATYTAVCTKTETVDWEVYRLYNTASGEHLFTTDVNEYATLPGLSGGD